VEVLSSRLHVSARDFGASRSFYEEALGLRVYREFGVGGRVTGVVFFCGGGYLEVGYGEPDGAPPPTGTFLWLQVDDVDAEHARLLDEVPGCVDEAPRVMPWGLRECWIHDPDGLRIALVQVPDDHPLRRRIE
jgi:predicted enzyme related to lactoylglutathione lyase